LRKKKVLVHGTQDSINNFLADAVSHDFEIVALLSEQLEKISVKLDDKELEVFASQSLPKFNYGLIDGVIITDGVSNESAVNFFCNKGLEPHKIIFWDAKDGWKSFKLPDADGKEIAYFCGLEFHILNEADKKFFDRTVKRLKKQRQLKNMNPNRYPELLAKDFQKKRGRPLDFDNPKTFTEKLKWLIVFDATPVKSRLADKYAVRSWVAEKIGDEYLIPLLGVWDDFDDINFDALPNQFVLKCNHGSSMNIIVRDKKIFDVQRAREKFQAWLATDFSIIALEPHYTRIDRKIIAEKFMANGDAPDINNYKFWCFNGEPLHCAVETGRSVTGSLANLRMDFFDINWKITDVERNDHPRSDHPENIPPPKNFELMKTLAATLSEGFSFVRVDLYEIEGKVYFGEMTFTPGAGNFYYKSEGTDEYLGSLLKLPVASAPPPDMILPHKKKFNPYRNLRRGFFFAIITRNFLGRRYFEEEKSFGARHARQHK